MEEMVAVVFECGACRKGSIVHVDARSFVANKAEITKREVVFRKQVECPKCQAMVGLEYTLDAKTMQSKTGIHASKTPKPNEKAGFLHGLFGGSSRTTEPSQDAPVQSCKAFQVGRCVVRGVDSGSCDWNPADWQRCNVVIETKKAYGQW